MTATAARAAQRIGRSSVVRRLARGGYAANGLLHILIGLLAVGVATRTGTHHADQSGALAALAETPGGVLLLWFMTVTVLALALWHVAGALTVRSPSRSRRWALRLDESGKAAVYVAVGLGSLTFALGDSADASADLRSFTFHMVGITGGVAILVLLGLSVIAIGAYYVTKGLTRRFRQDIDLPEGIAGRAVVVLGVFGYVSKGIALGIVGLLFITAAITSDWWQASGLDGALRSLSRMPFGVALLFSVAGGFMAAGLYYFVRAGRARLR